MRPIFCFIGLSCREQRFSESKQQNLRTSIGHARGCPRLPGHPNITYFGLLYLSEGFLVKKFHQIGHISPNRQFGYFLSKIGEFGEKSPIWRIFCIGILETYSKVPYTQIWGPRRPMGSSKTPCYPPKKSANFVVLIH